MSIQIFLSAVSDEFSTYRDQLRHDLTRQNVEVKIQEDFKDLGTVTLDKLDTYIAACDAVVHLVGDMTGAPAKPASTKAIVGKNPDLADKLPPLREPIEKRGDISYTQWEAWLALYHNKLLQIAKPHNDAPRGPRFKPTDTSRAKQRMHLKRLSEVERYPGDPFTSPDNLAKQILSGAILDLLAIEKSVTALSSTTKQINVSVTKRHGKYDVVRLEELRAVEHEMAAVNGEKKSNIDQLRDYLNKQSADDWAAIQRSCKKIADNLHQLRSKQPEFIHSIGFENAGDLAAALETQERIYDRLSKLSEPVTNAARIELGTTIKKLEKLRKEVVDLELSIDAYLRKFKSARRRVR